MDSAQRRRGVEENKQENTITKLVPFESVTVYKYYKTQWHLITKNYDYQSTFATGMIVYSYIISRIFFLSALRLQPNPSVTVLFFFSFANYKNE